MDSPAPRYPPSKTGERTIAFLKNAWQHRIQVGIWMVIAALLSAGVGFGLLTVYYRSTATLLPESGRDNFSALSQLSGVAELAGLGPGTGSITKDYPAIMSSDSLLRIISRIPYHTSKFANPVTLVQYFGYGDEDTETGLDKTIRKLRQLLAVSSDAKTGVVTASIDLPEPQLAADALNNLVSELDAYLRFRHVSHATEQVRWISQRLNEVQSELAAAEDRLKDFRERNRRVADSPDLLLEQERLMRNVQTSSTVFIELKRQYEIARIEELRDQPLVNVLDVGRPAVRHSSPHRLMIIIVCTILAGISGMFYYGFTPDPLERFKKAFQSAAVAAH